MPEASIRKIQQSARESGLHLIGITDVSPNPVAEKRLLSWQNAGYAGDLEYMLREAGRFCDPRALVPEAASVLVFSVNYGSRPHLPLRPGYGRVARYAWGRDYHRIIRKRAKKFLAELSASLNEPVQGRVFTDAVPLVERAFAQRGGGGFIGKNTMLIRPGEGSYFFLAELVSDLTIKDSSSLNVLTGECGSCSRCIERCPTDAFVDEFVLDSRKCISYLTIEKRGGFEPQERRLLGEWVFGCDVCQDVCPFNHTGLKMAEGPNLDELAPEQGAGDQLSLSELLEIRRDEDFVGRFAGTPLMRAKRAGLLRNAACVAATTGAEMAIPALTQAVTDDCSAVVRQHALWALAQLHSAGATSAAFRGLLERGLNDPSELVQQECRNALENAQAHAEAPRGDLLLKN